MWFLCAWRWMKFLSTLLLYMYIISDVTKYMAHSNLHTGKINRSAFITNASIKLSNLNDRHSLGTLGRFVIPWRHFQFMLQCEFIFALLIAIRCRKPGVHSYPCTFFEVILFNEHFRALTFTPADVPSIFSAFSLPVTLRDSIIHLWWKYEKQAPIYNNRMLLQTVFLRYLTDQQLRINKKSLWKFI